MKRIKDFINKDIIIGSIFILPWVIGVLVFTAFPFLFSLYLSFTKYDMLSSPQWIGLANYIKIFTNDPKFFESLFVTFKLVFIAIPLRLVISLLIALLLVRPRKGVGIYRSIVYIPSLIGGSVAIAVMWRNLFSVNGLINSLFGTVGLPSDTNWLGNVVTALIPIIILMAWQFGSSMLVFVAGLKNISQSYYEAAGVDGANKFRMFFSITLPMLSPIILFNLLMQTISGFMVFTPSYLITQGGPLNSTKVYAMYMFQEGINQGKMGYASALAWIMVIIIGIATGLILKSSNKWVFYEN